MRALFCDKTSDITLLLENEEIRKIKPTKHQTPFLDANSDEHVFHLSVGRSKNYIDVKEPHGDYNHYWIKLSEQAFLDLSQKNRCGHRYAHSSKITVRIDDERN